MSKFAPMHSSLVRLYELAKSEFDAVGPSQVANIIRQSAQTISNWSSRGVSRIGAIEIERNLGWSATYIREGKGPKLMGGPSKRKGAEAPAAAPPASIVPPNLVRYAPIVGHLHSKKGVLIYSKCSTKEAIVAFTNGQPGRAYSIRCDNFTPRYRSGDYLVVGPNMKAKAGDDVIVFLRGEADDYIVVRFTRQLSEDFEFVDIARTEPRTVAMSSVVSIEKIIGCYGDFAKVTPMNRSG